MAALGHEDQFPPPSLSGGCRLGKATFAGTGGKEEDAPFPVMQIELVKPTRSGHPLVSFNDLVGAGEQGRRDFEAERSGGLESDGGPVFRGGLH